jgi:hypothetical protein
MILTKTLIATGLLFAIALLMLLVFQGSNRRTVNQIWQSLASIRSNKVFTPEMVAAQPEPVQRYFLHAIALGTPIATAVQLQMRGSFRLGQDKPWMAMRATEIISPKGFVWQATMGQGLLQLRGADYSVDGMGRVQFSLAGLLPVVDAQGPDITRASIGRLAGELTWLPAALLPQQGVSWRAIDDHTIEATQTIAGETVPLTLEIDSDGRLLRLSFPRWGDQTEDQHFAYIPFGSEVQREQTIGGYTIPAQVSAGWGFGTDRYVESFRAIFEQAQFF